MKRSMIAVCLLLLSPARVLACVEDHNPGAGWYRSAAFRLVDLRHRSAVTARGLGSGGIARIWRAGADDPGGSFCACNGSSATEGRLERDATRHSCPAYAAD